MSIMHIVAYAQPQGNVCLNVNGWLMLEFLALAAVIIGIPLIFIFLLVRMNRRLGKLEGQVAEINKRDFPVE